MPHPIARREGAALALVGLVLLAVLGFAVVEARRNLRDDTRRDHLAGLKRSLEDVNNRLGHYPAPPAGAPSCADSLRADDWLFGSAGVLRSLRLVTTPPSDPRLPNAWGYRYCVTQQDSTGAAQWYLRTRIERRQPAKAAFDSELDHNFYYRVVREGDAVFYDICGGTLTCGAPPHRQ